LLVLEGSERGSMTLYEYRCPDHGLTSVWLRMGTAPPTVACPVCDAAAERVYHAPTLLTSRSSPRASLIERCEKSRDEPAVVTSPPRRDPHKRTPMAPANPALRRLPRP
jgi:putative FmdB family regulatory protein